jgi:NADPH2:quinone reductase
MTTNKQTAETSSVVFDFNSNQFMLRNIVKPSPGPGCVLVQVHCCGLNPVDAKISQWQGMIAESERNKHKHDSTFVLGLDVVGTVVEHGKGVSTPAIGTHVLYHGRMLEPYGGLASFSVHEASTLLPVHPSWSAKLDDVLLAAVPCAAWTAMKIVRDKCHVEQGDTVLVYGASGGVGSFVAQFAKHLGASTVIGVCSTSNVEFAVSCGCDHVVDYKQLGEHATVKDAVLALTSGRGVDKAIDLVGQETSEICTDLLAFDGVVCPVVALANPSATEDQFGRGLSFTQVSLGAAHRADKRAKERLVSLAQDTMNVIISHDITVPVSRVISIDEAPAVLTEMVAAHTRGKIVVQVANAKDLSKGDMSSQAVMKEGELGASDGKSISKRITAVCGVSILNREKFDSLVEDMVLLEQTTPGTLQFEWFVDENDPTEAVLLETFEDEHAQLQHMNNFATFRDRFGCMKFHTFRYYGPVTAAVRERVAKHPFQFYQTVAELRR